MFINDNFSIAFGTWEDGNKYVAMRWNGDGGDAGYLKVFGHPIWFLINAELRLSILQSLVGLANTDKEKLLEVLDEGL